jgi:predicted nucleic acid-binding protein
MRVVTDNTPLRYLLLLGYVDVLPALYGRVIVPRAVVTELAHPKAPEAVRAWIATPPAWVDVRQATGTADAALAVLDAGEREAILLMQELQGDLLWIDEEDGYEAATQRGMRCLRTVGLLEHAGQQGLVDLPEAIARLRRTNFRIRPDVLDDVLARDAERRRPQASPEHDG